MFTFRVVILAHVVAVSIIVDIVLSVLATAVVLIGFFFIFVLHESARANDTNDENDKYDSENNQHLPRVRILSHKCGSDSLIVQSSIEEFL